MSTIQVRVDDDLKSKADALFKELGTDTTSAIRMFLTQAVAYDGIPFEIKKFNKTKEMKIMTEDEFLDRLASSRVQSREGKVIDADIAIVALEINMDYKVIFTENSIVFIDGIYHQLQDYENKIK